MGEQGQYDNAAACARGLLHFPPQYVLEDFEQGAPGGKESPDAILDRWCHLPGPDGSEEAKMRAAANRLANFIAMARKAHPERKPVTGWRQGYLTWRISARKAALLQPTTSGIILEWRQYSFDQQCWPYRSIDEPDPTTAVDWNERFVARLARVDRISFAGARAGSWSDAAYGSPGLSVAAHYLLIPYWLLIVLGLAAPGRMALLQMLRWRRSRAGRCVSCGYDLRGSAERCPECGRAFVFPKPRPIPQADGKIEIQKTGP